MASLLNLRGPVSNRLYIDWLKSLGCVLWLPLETPGDLNERLTGNPLVTTSDTRGYLEWDTTNNMYYMHSGPTTSAKYYTLQTEWDSTTFVNNEFTALTEFKRKSSTGLPLWFMLGNTNSVPAGAATIYNGTNNMSSWDAYRHKAAYYIGPSYRKIYQDGALYRQYAAHNPYLPSNWGSWEWFIGTYTATNTTNCECYVKNIMIFNRELSLSEINKIQNIQ